MTVVVIDFETYYDKDVSVTSLGSVAYARHPQADVQLIAAAKYVDGNKVYAEVGTPDTFHWDKFTDADLWVAHNAAFEQSVFDVLKQRGAAPFINPVWQCSANCSAYHTMARSLQEAAQVVLGVKPDKEVRKEMKGVRWHTLSDTDKRRWAEYNMNDVLLSAQLWHKLNGGWPEIEQRLSKLTLEQARRGVAINQERLDLYISQLEHILEVNEKRLPWRVTEIDDHDNGDDAPPPGSVKAVNAYCTKFNIPPMPVKIHDRWGYETWCQRYGHLEWVRSYITYTQLRKLYTDLVKLRRRLIDGIFYFELAYFGTYTGRWAGCGGWNMQNIRRSPVFVDQDCYLLFRRSDTKPLLDLVASGQPLPPHVAYVFDERSLFVARPGHNLVVIDLAQIEPRILAHFAGQTQLLDRMRRGESIYEAFARMSGQWTRPEPLKKADPALYHAVKAQVLGLGYGCGEAKYREVAYKLVNMDLDLATARKHKLLYRQVAHEVVRYWADMDYLLQTALRQKGELEIEVSPWRKLRYTQLVGQTKFYIDKPRTPNSAQIVKYEVSGKIGTKSVEKLWGGKLVENKVQSCARDVFAEAVLRAERAGIGKCLWTVHDEAIFEVPEGTDVSELERCMKQPPEWLQIPLDVDLTVTKFYRK